MFWWLTDTIGFLRAIERWFWLPTTSRLTYTSFSSSPTF